MHGPERQTGLTDEGLRSVEAAKSGDAAAFGRLYVELRPRVRNSAYRLLRDEHEAEDTAQDAFLAAFVSLPRLADASAFEAWLMRIARNRAVDRRRRMLKCRPSDRAHDEAADDARELPRVIRRSGVAETPADSLASLRAALAEMAPALREVLLLRYARGLSCEQIAAQAGITVVAVKTRLFRARRKVREALLSAPPPGARAPALGEKTCVSSPRR
jgi:RNA polymerase sigma-70 factor, ECF subfamily